MYNSRRKGRLSMKALRTTPCALVAIVFAFTAPCRANLIITPTFDSSITSDPHAAVIEGTINTAINFYESTFSNPITVDITFQEMSSGLGQSSFEYFTSLLYSTYRNALVNDANANGNTTLQNAIAASVPNQANNPVTNQSTIDIHQANAYALGLFGNTASGTVGLNTSLTFPPNAQSGGTYSLLAVTEHEINEILGLGSALNLSGGSSNLPFPEDFYRYAGGSTARNYTTSGDNAYFTLNGGITDILQFNQFANGSDFGDWHSCPGTASTPNVQDACGTPNTILSLNTLSPEVLALESIGYDLASPEPGTMVFLTAGLAAMAALVRRRARVSTKG